MNMRKTAAWTAIAAAVVALVAPSASAAETTPVSDADLAKVQSITVNAAEGQDISGRTMKAIPLGSYTAAQTDGTNVTGYDMDTDATAKASIVKALEQFDTDAKTPGIQVADKTDDKKTVTIDADNPMAWVVENLLDSNTSPWAGKLRDFLTALSKDETFKAIEGTPLTAVEGHANQQSAGNLKPGVYAVLDTTATGEASIPMLNGTKINGMNLVTAAGTYTLGDVTYKTLPVDTPVKKIVEGDKKLDQTTGTVGKKVSFEITQKIPASTGYDTRYFAITDRPTHLTVDQDSIQIKVGNTALVKDTDYRQTVDGKNIKWEFGSVVNDAFVSNIANNAKFPADATITISYDATVDQDAVVGGQGNPNTVELEYGNNPNASDQHETTPGNTTKVYTGKFGLHKVDAKNQPLNGATFQVWETDAAGNQTGDPIKFKLADGAYTPSAANDASADVKAGDAIVSGLKAGKYVVKETGVPEGYMQQDTQFTVTVTVTPGADDADATVTVAVDGKNASMQDDNLTVQVRNVRNLLEMATTGANGLILAVSAGVLLLGGSALLLRRRSVA